MARSLAAAASSGKSLPQRTRSVHMSAGSEEEEAQPGKYTQFWSSFGKAMKLGIIEDTTNKQRLAKLVRVHTTHDPDKLTSLDAYVSRMPESQKEIYYLAGGLQCCFGAYSCRSWLQPCYVHCIT